MWVEYYIDGEKTPSIGFQPAFMCGLAFPNDIKDTDLYQAGAACGKNAAVGGWYNTFPIPFAKSALVTIRNNAAGCSGGYVPTQPRPNPTECPSAVCTIAAWRSLMLFSPSPPRAPIRIVCSALKSVDTS